MWLLICCLTFFGVYAVNDDYQSRAYDLMTRVSRQFLVQDCIDAAQQKAGQFYPGGPQHFAIAWISMYSRLCHIPQRQLRQDITVNNFPFRLNKELRCAFHTGRDPTVKDTFQQVGDIINEALQIMRPRHWRDLYRGLETFIYRNQSYFVEEGFFSASTSLYTGLVFAKGKILMIVRSMTGVYIANYAEDRFQIQKEVLAQTRSVFRVTDTINDNNQVNDIMSQLRPPQNLQKPREIIYVEQVTNVNLNAVLPVQRANAITYCDPQW